MNAVRPLPGMEPAVLIVGLGNILLTDDGVGVHAARALQQAPPAGTVVLEAGTAVLDILGPLEEAGARGGRVLALDAVQAGGAPGTIYRLELTNDAPPAGDSLHELDLRGVLRLLRPEVRPAATVLGIEPASLEYGMQLSPTLQQMFLPYLVQIRRCAAQLTRGTHSLRRPA